MSKALGIFFERRPQQVVVQEAIHEALELNPDNVSALEEEAAARADVVTDRLDAGMQLNKNRFLIALAIVAVLIIAAIATEAADLSKSSSALWGLTTTVFGVIVGFLGGEATAQTQ